MYKYEKDKKMFNPYNKVTGSECLFVQKDLTNRRTIMVLLYNVGPEKVFNYLRGAYQTPLKKNRLYCLGLVLVLNISIMCF